MASWRLKVLFLLISYSAGFLTAIYCLAPVPAENIDEHGERSFAHSVLKSDEFARDVSCGLYRCLDFMKDIANRVSGFAKEKFDGNRAGD